MKNNTYYSPFKSTKTFFNREDYDSGYEARFAGACHFLGIDFRHNDMVFLFDDASSPQYKPDFNWTASTGEIVVVEIKGWDNEEWQGKYDRMKKLIDDPKEKVIALIFATRDGKDAILTIYQNKQELPAAFYKCPSCGKAYISAKAHNACPRCGETDVDYVCVDFNEWYNQESEIRREKYVKDFAQKSKQLKEARASAIELTNKLRHRIEIIAKNEKWKIFDGEMGVLSPYATGTTGEYRPDFHYVEPKKGYRYFGTVCMPFVPVFVSAKPSELEKMRYEEMKTYVADKYCPVVKAVLIDADGIHVCDDKQHTPSYEEGAVFKCDKCHTTYFARLNEHECPCCNSYKTHKVSK